MIRYSFSLQPGGIFCGRCARQKRKRRKEKKSQYGKGIRNRRNGKRERQKKEGRQYPNARKPSFSKLRDAASQKDVANAWVQQQKEHRGPFVEAVPDGHKERTRLGLLVLKLGRVEVCIVGVMCVVWWSSDGRSRSRSRPRRSISPSVGV